MNKNKLLHLQFLYKNNYMFELEKNIVYDYPLLGTKTCMIKYNVSYGKIRWICEKYKLLVNNSTKSLISKENTINSWKNRIIKHSVNENMFIKNITKESSYLLGFIWGDGYINNTGRNNQIRIECVSEDIDVLKPILEKTGNWKFYCRLRTNKKREVTIALTSNKNLVDFLIEYDYKKKSIKTPKKIWSLIPEEYKKYFILGWIDADGCFYWNEKRKLRQFCISGSYEQDWSVFEEILNTLNVKYKINRINNKLKHSYIRTTGKENINKLGDYIFNDIIPFQRKFEKYKLIIG